MPQKTPRDAVRQPVERLQSAIGCITERRISAPRWTPHFPNTIHASVLNENNPVELVGERPLSFSGGQEFRIVQDHEVRGTQFRATTVQYWYQFAIPSGIRLLTFHWTPEVNLVGQRKYPHLHVESALLDNDGPFLPDTFSKLHIPTGQLPLESIVRFAIEELGVEPIPNDWSERLRVGEEAFERRRDDH